MKLYKKRSVIINENYCTFTIFFEMLFILKLLNIVHVCIYIFCRFGNTHDLQRKLLYSEITFEIEIDKESNTMYLVSYEIYTPLIRVKQ